MKTSDQPKTVQLKRLINTTPACAFAAWTQPAQIKQWFGPSSCRVLDAQVDLRVGGAYRFLVFNEQFGKMAVSGEYREVNAPAKLGFTWKWDDDPDWKNVKSIVTVEFVKKGGQTEVLLRHEGFPNAESANNHEHGWTGGLDKLEVRASLAAEAFGPGRFSWNELLTTDVDGAASFYTKLFGWETAPFRGGDMPYTLFKSNGLESAGLMKIPMPEMPPHWLPYVTVENVDATAARITELGGNVGKEPFDIPNVGRIAIAQDPQGATFGIFQPMNK